MLQEFTQRKNTFSVIIVRHVFVQLSKSTYSKTVLNCQKSLKRFSHRTHKKTHKGKI